MLLNEFNSNTFLTFASCFLYVDKLPNQYVKGDNKRLSGVVPNSCSTLSAEPSLRAVIK